MEPPTRRNVELKAADPDPERSLATCLALGAEDRGVLRQRDTYFVVPAGRLKLREETPGGAQLIQYERPDEAAARLSRYRLVEVGDPAELRAALDAALGTLVVVDKERRLLLWEGVRIHLDAVAGLGSFIELEGVAADGSDLGPERALVDRLARELGLGEPGRELEPGSYSDRLLAAGAAPGPEGAAAAREARVAGPEGTAARRSEAPPRRAGTLELLAAARAAMARAHAPYSGYRVGAALRASDGSVHAGANVENSAFSEGQCAEASALGALVAAGGRAVAEVLVVTGADAPAVPCGGCRQRLTELAPPGTPVHLAGRRGVERTEALGDLLPLAFGPDRLPA